MHRAACRGTNSVLNALIVLLMHLRTGVTTLSITDIPTLTRLYREAPPIASDGVLELLAIPNRDEVQAFHNIILEAIAISRIPLEGLEICQRCLYLRPDYLTEEAMFSQMMATIKKLVIATCGGRRGHQPHSGLCQRYGRSTSAAEFEDKSCQLRLLLLASRRS